MLTYAAFIIFIIGVLLIFCVIYFQSLRKVIPLEVHEDPGILIPASRNRIQKNNSDSYSFIDKEDKINSNYSRLPGI